MKNALINVTKNVMDEKTSKEVGKKIVITTIVADVALVGIYAIMNSIYLKLVKKQQEKEDEINGNS